MNISLCIPTYEQFGKGVKHLTQLLLSAELQNGEFEIVISDNSKDDEIEYCVKTMFNHLPIVYIRNNETFGVSANTNNAIKHASNDKIKILYQDDFFINVEAMEKFDKALDKAHWVVCNSVYLTPKENQKLKVPFWHEDIIKGHNTIGMPSMIGIRKNEFEFDTNIVTLLDCEYYFTLYGKFGHFYHIHDELVCQRLWNESISSTHGNRSVEEWEYVRKKHNL